MNILCISQAILAAIITTVSCNRFTEEERVAYWHEHHKYWPPQWHNESESYKAHIQSVEKEIMSLTGSTERWENWMQFVHGQLCPKFTPRGFDVVKIPERIFQKLKAAVDIGLSNWDDLPIEDASTSEGHYHETPYKFIHLDGLQNEVMDELTSFHESWVGGMELVGTSAYGIRMYTNGSSLVMHHDKIETHVISSIMHIAHQYDDDKRPWHLQIEDHDGKLHSLALQPGEMLFYESARCLHGRMSKLYGKYYGSLFVHYKPKDPAIWNFEYEDVINAVPPHWRDGTTEETGSRWAGQGITVDSRAAAGAPPRVINGKFIHDFKTEHTEL